MLLTDLALYRSDFRETLTNVAEVGGCDLLLTSPPYGKQRVNPETYGPGFTMNDYHDLGVFALSALKRGGNLVVIVGDNVKDGMASLLPQRVQLLWCKIGLLPKQTLIYRRRGVPGAYKGSFRKDHEYILWFKKEGKECYFNKRSLAIKSKSGSYKGRKDLLVKQDGSQTSRKSSGWASERDLTHIGSIWEYATGFADRGRNLFIHPAPFAERFALDAVTCFCPPGGLVCDPFVGSGTTAVAAVTLGRRFIGGDMYGKDGISWTDYTYRRVEKGSGIGHKYIEKLLGIEKKRPGYFKLKK